MSGRRGGGPGLARYLPALGWLGGYRGRWLRGDLVAGVTAAAVVIPQAMATPPSPACPSRPPSAACCWGRGCCG